MAHKALHAVHMKDGLRGQPVAQRGDFRNGHDNARLVAYLHHADHGRVFRKHAFQRFQIHRTLPGQRNFHSLAAEAGLRLPAGILHCRMLGGGVEHLALAPQGLQMAQNGQIVAFRTAGGKITFFAGTPSRSASAFRATVSSFSACMAGRTERTGLK